MNSRSCWLIQNGTGRKSNLKKCSKAQTIVCIIFWFKVTAADFLLPYLYSSNNYSSTTERAFFDLTNSSNNDNNNNSNSIDWETTTVGDDFEGGQSLNHSQNEPHNATVDSSNFLLNDSLTNFSVINTSDSDGNATNLVENSITDFVLLQQQQQQQQPNESTTNFAFVNESHQQFVAAAAVNNFEAPSVITTNMTNDDGNGSLKNNFVDNKNGAKLKKPLTNKSNRSRVNNVFELSSKMLLNSTINNHYKSARAGKVTLLGLFELTTKQGVRPEGQSELAAARLAVKHINRQNLLPGYTLELITNDTQVSTNSFFFPSISGNARVEEGVDLGKLKLKR